MKTCENCLWWQDEVCCNADSEYCAEFTLKDDNCPEWEEKDVKRDG